MPIALPGSTNRREKSIHDELVNEPAVACLAMILKPGSMRSIAFQITWVYPMMLPPDHPAHTREIALCSVCVDTMPKTVSL